MKLSLRLQEQDYELFDHDIMNALCVCVCVCVCVL